MSAPPSILHPSDLLHLGSSKAARVIRVTKGELVLFYTKGIRSQPHHFLTSIREGELIFDAGWHATGSEALLFAEALPGTEFAIDPAESLASEERASALERWMKALLGAILHLGEEESAFTHPTVPGEEVPPLKRGEVLGLRSGVGWWLPEGSGARYLETTPPAGILLPLIPRLGVEITAEMPASRLLSTSELLSRPDWLAALSQTQALLSHALWKALEHLESEQRDHARERASLSAAAQNHGWRELAQVMMRSDASEGASAPATRSVEIAFQRVAKQIGVELKTPGPLQGTTEPLEKIAELARSSSLRWRQVVLQDRWYEHDHGPIIALMGGTHEAVALLPHGARRYRLVDAAGRSQPVTEALAQQLDPQAATLYRTLPPGTLGLRDLLSFSLKGSFSDIWLILMMVIITGLLGLATPALSARIYDVIIPQSEHGMMAQIVLILIVAAITQSLFELVRSMTLMRVENRANSQLQAAVWDRLLRLPSRFFRRFTSGDLAGRVQGVTDAHQLLASTGVSILFILPVGLFNLLVMFWQQRTLALWGLGIAVAGTLFSLALSFAEVLVLRRRFEIQGKLSGIVVQMINGVGKLRMANAEAFAFNTWARQYAEQEQLAMKAGRWSAISQTFFSGFSLLVMAVLFGLVGWQMSQDARGTGLSTGSFLAFNAAFGALIAALVNVAQQSLSLLHLVPMLERTKPIFETEPEAEITRVPPGPLQGEIEINNLTFSYRPDTPPVLDRFSLKIRPGEMIALVGPSGCGKSTLLRLMLGFETPDSGTIFYDGKDLQTLNLQETRRQIGVVLQNTQLFAGDIFRNIVGESNLTLEDAWDAARMAGLEEDILKMPMQMHTVVSEGGTSFSGGQKQRLAIARAFAHKPRLLFFDEATSALDNRTQAMVTASMEALQVTRVIVAHRLSTILQAQRIIVLQNGAICEEGTFDTLMAQRGVFYELARHQMA